MISVLMLLLPLKRVVLNLFDTDKGRSNLTVTNHSLLAICGHPIKMDSKENLKVYLSTFSWRWRVIPKAVSEATTPRTRRYCVTWLTCTRTCWRVWTVSVWLPGCHSWSLTSSLAQSICRSSAPFTRSSHPSCLLLTELTTSRLLSTSKFKTVYHILFKWYLLSVNYSNKRWLNCNTSLLFEA